MTDPTACLVFPTTDSVITRNRPEEEKITPNVGINNFKSEFKFVKKLLSDITVDSNHTRIAIVTFSSPSNIIKNVDEISQSSKEETKCLLLNRQLKNINYSGGETFTVGAFQIAKEIFDNASRNNSKKVLFLITDGYSSGGDPVPVADKLKNKHVTVFTIGIESGNYKELYELSFSGGESYSYILDSFKELNSLARRALHTDLRNGEYIPIGENQPCNILCSESDCCDSKALCTCGTTTGHYACICQKGYYGSGLKNSCIQLAEQPSCYYGKRGSDTSRAEATVQTKSKAIFTDYRLALHKEKKYTVITGLSTTGQRLAEI
ncbi:sushi, von Willebrand factor type A, EGF and pentraxin domain-containing protein 1-like [Anoplophora glabripennis]|uniref:sushi, von Willebrand factor type A, EGF and pentraxin domain-containing protein 1-like n=1 Tax=Anoplophora glabripennis TaxID=217634 RepID=UPI000C77C865|nr:sushi, von Willebrand factor type A, EGF and pentraxin domain-containing protein 1-like [Anoplophora glabripennis]